MPKRRDETPDESVEDLFEDLDKFFQPIREPDWPEAEPGQEPRPEDQRRPEDVPAGETGLPEGEWPDIAVPHEAELLGAVGDAPEDRGELTVDDLRKAPPQYADLPVPPGEDAEVVAEEAEEGPAADQERLVASDESSDEAEKRTGRGERRVKRALGRRGRRRPESTEEPGPPEIPIEEEGGREGAEEAPALEDTLAAEYGALEEGITADEPIVIAEAAEEARAQEAAFEEEPLPMEGEGTADEEPPGREAVEAAADHFAEGLRATPEEVEADLLADLEGSRHEPGTVSIEPTVAAGGPPAGAPAGRRGAPSWEEPGIAAAEPEEAAPAGLGPGRNLVAAFATGIILVVAALALLRLGKAPFAVLAGAVILLGQGELYAVMRTRGRHPATALGLVAGALMVAGGYTAGEPGLLLGVTLGMVTAVLWFMAAQPGARKDTILDIGATVLGVVYVPFLASFALVMLQLPGEQGRNLLLVVVGLTVLYDVLAYAVGSLWGSRALAPTISPLKSWEGVWGATLGVVVVGMSLVPVVSPFVGQPARAVGLALVVAVFAPIGDLVESAIKRDLGVKDMSSILPGHGGILDRIDSILFVAPAAWYFYLIVF